MAEPVSCDWSTEGTRPDHFGCAIQSTVDVTGDGIANDQETIQIITIDRS